MNLLTPWLLYSFWVAKARGTSGWPQPYMHIPDIHPRSWKTTLDESQICSLCPCYAVLAVPPQPSADGRDNGPADHILGEYLGDNLWIRMFQLSLVQKAEKKYGKIQLTPHSELSLADACDWKRWFFKLIRFQRCRSCSRRSAVSFCGATWREVSDMQPMFRLVERSWTESVWAAELHWGPRGMVAGVKMC